MSQKKKKSCITGGVTGLVIGVIFIVMVVSFVGNIDGSYPGLSIFDFLAMYLKQPVYLYASIVFVTISATFFAVIGAVFSKED